MENNKREILNKYGFNGDFQRDQYKLYDFVISGKLLYCLDCDELELYCKTCHEIVMNALEKKCIQYNMERYGRPTVK